jgi:hypothetical protein
MQLAEVLPLVQGYEVASSEEAEFAERELQEVKSQWATIEARRKEITAPLNQALKSANDLFRPVLSGLKDIEAAWNRKITGYLVERRKEQERLLAEAANTEDIDEVHEALTLAAEAVPEVAVRDVWKFAIVDADAIPREFMIPDEAAIGKVVRALKEKTNIPGVAVFNEQIVPKKRGG